MYKIIWNSDKSIYAEYEHYNSYCAAVEELPELMPYDIDDQGDLCIIDDGDSYDE